MANIQPFDYQKRTNIEEHNQLVNKVNEIVGVINDTNLDTINSEIANLKSKATETDTEITNIKNKDTVQDTYISNIKDKVAMQDTEITNIKDKDTNQDTEISNIKNKDAMQDTEISNIKNKDAMQDTEIQGITKSLVSDVVLMSGTTTGNIKARIKREDAPSIDSNDYNIQKPVSVELVQGSASAMVKAQITLSDGTVLISDDFMFTTESIGTDVYISSFVFKNGNVAGSISADIGLSNGSTLEANNFVVPTDPSIISSISDLQNRVTAIESGAGSLAELKVTVAGHTTSINNLNTEVADLNGTVDGHTTSINKLNTDVADLKTDKADVNNGNQSITAGTINANNINKGGVAVATVNDIPDISGKVNIAQGTENAGKVLGIGENGNVTPVKVSSGGEAWEEIDYSNPPTDWANGDRIKVMFELYSTSTESEGYGYSHNNIVEGMIKQDSGMIYANRIEGEKYSTKSEIYFSLNRLSFYLPNLNNGYFDASMWYGVLDTTAMSFKSISNKALRINISDIPNYTINGYQRIRMWRLKQST